MEKILLDTDIGCDIDDAVCLAYLLSKDDCELMGITTVNGDTGARAQLASVLVKASGKKVPIFPGKKDTMLIDRTRKPVPQAAALPLMEHDVEFAESGYLEFMRKTIMDNPGEVTLLAIGPMTNVGLLLSAYPEAAENLKRLVLMGGNFTNPLTAQGYMESNTMCDPHASALVYRADVKQHVSIGNDVTSALGMSKETVYDVFKQNAMLRAALPMIDVYFSSGIQTMYFHDLCAAMYIFRPEIATLSGGKVEVELNADALKGMTVLKHAAYYQPPYHKAAVSVDGSVFYDEFYKTFAISQ